jgi:hypothetical protein
MSADSVLSALQLCFWVRDDRSERLGRNIARNLDEHQSRPVTFAIFDRLLPLGVRSNRVGSKRLLVERGPGCRLVFVSFKSDHKSGRKSKSKSTPYKGQI